MKHQSQMTMHLANELVELRQRIDQMEDSETGLESRDERLLERQNHLRTIIDSVPALVAYVDSGERYQFNNKAYEAWFGQSLTSFRGKRVEEVLGEAMYSRVRRRIHEALSGRAVHFETTVTHGKDGDVRHLSVSYVPEIAEDGSVKGFFALVSDVTDSKLAERNLRESEDRFRRIFEQSNDSILLLDPWEDRIVEANPQACRILKYSRDELLATPLSVIHPDDMPGLLEFSKTVFEHGAATTDQLACRTKTGELVAVELSASVVEYGGKRLMLALARDHTERKRAEKALLTNREQLEALSRRLIDVQETERGHIARELHDEIGQALTAVKLELQSVERRLHDAPLTRVIARTIDVVDEAMDAVRNLALDLRPPLLDQRGLVAALRWYAERQMLRAGVALTFSADALGERPSSKVETASYRMAQEALTNVARHSGAQNVVVQVRRTPHNIELTVRDDGIGFDTSTSQAAPHLGLVGMRERAHSVGGDVAIESTPGVGTLVRASFPTPRSEEDLRAPTLTTAGTDS